MEQEIYYILIPVFCSPLLITLTHCLSLSVLYFSNICSVEVAQQVVAAQQAAQQGIIYMFRDPLF